MSIFFDKKCVKCEGEIINDSPTKDHIKPISKGGSDAINNIQPMCRECNAGKVLDQTDYRLIYCKTHNKKMPSEWLANTSQISGNTETDTYTETELDIDKPISKRDRGEDKFLFESLFEDFWKNYIPIKTESGKFVPKGDKQPAKAKYIALLKASKDPQVLAKEIKEGLSNYLRGCSHSGTLTKHAIRFLRNETWKESEEDNNTFILSEANNETNRKGADEIAEQYNFLMSEIEDRKARRSSTL